MIPEVVGLIAVAVFVAAILFVIHKYKSEQVGLGWGEAAQILGLQFEPSRLFSNRPTRLVGTIDGFEVEAYIYPMGRGSNHPRPDMGFSVAYSPMGLGLSLKRETFWRRIGKALGGQDIEVDGAGFDEDVVVKGRDQSEIIQFLTPARRAAVQRLLLDSPSARVDDSCISVGYHIRVRDTDGVVSIVRRLVAVASLLTGDGSAPVEKALQMQAGGNASAAALALEESADGGPEILFLAGQAEYAAGRYEEAEKSFGAVAEALPADELVAAWRRRAGERAAVPTLPAPRKEPVLTSAAELAGEVFDPGRLSFDATRLFEEKYEGRPVSWRGTLKRVNTVRSDLDFGGGPGTKALVTVHRLSVDLFGGRDVDAVVWLPEEADERLRDRVGEEVGFTGVLLRCDPLMRNLYVADGRLSNE